MSKCNTNRDTQVACSAPSGEPLQAIFIRAPEGAYSIETAHIDGLGGMVMLRSVSTQVVLSVLLFGTLWGVIYSGSPVSSRAKERLDDIWAIDIDFAVIADTASGAVQLIHRLWTYAPRFTDITRKKVLDGSSSGSDVKPMAYIDW